LKDIDRKQYNINREQIIDDYRHKVSKYSM